MSDEGAAIVGMAALFPGAPDLDTFASNVFGGVDAITLVPPHRIDPVFFDAASTAPDRFYVRRGGFVDAHARFDALAFGVMPVAAEGAEPDQLLGLALAARALEDAGYDEATIPRERTSVILGRGNYIGAGMTRLEQHVRTAEQLAACLRDLLPSLSEEQVASVKRAFQAKLGRYGPDTAIGLVPNLTASRIANRLDLHGSAYTVDAACASSLVAVDHAVSELATGRADLVLAGGIHLSHDVALWSVFCQLGALSRSGVVRPFDRRADGVLVGEGAGIVVLKRVDDAVRDGDRIYAIVRGTGVASDGRATSLMSPEASGQIRALERAWAAAKLDPRDVGLVEAHGTATPAGDAVELTTLARFFGPLGRGEERAGLGSIKSMIGHAMPAAGIAGLVKAALAVWRGILPPSLHCEEPHPGLEPTRFRVIREAEPWRASRRIAGVNAFGFGGIDAHVVLSSHDLARGASTAVARAVAIEAKTERPRMLALAAPDRASLLSRLDDTSRWANLGQGRARVAIFDPTPERLAKARRVIDRGKPWRGREGIWFSAEPLCGNGGGKIAFLFPGVDASFSPRVRDVAERFGLPVPACTDAATTLEEIGFGIIGTNRLLDRVVRALGVVPDAIAGHSIGEWSGMIASGMIPEDAADAFASTLRPGTLEVPGVLFAAAACGLERAAEAIRGLERIAVSHDNCPHQVVLCGEEASIQTAIQRLASEGVLAQVLPFRSGFHSPLLSDYLGPHREHFARMPLVAPKVPLWSATTCAPYPTDPEAARRLAIEHLVQPVRFRELLLALHDAGARAFVQVGTGSLVGLVTDTLRERPHLAIAANARDRSGLDQLACMLGALFVEGALVDPSRVDPDPDRAAPRGRGTIVRSSGRDMALALGVPLVHVDVRLEPLSSSSPAPPADNPADPVAGELRRLFEDVRAAGEEIARAWKAREGGARASSGTAADASITTIEMSVARWPELADHTFFRQPEGWPDLADRHPVVPMTMTLALVVEAAKKLRPGRVAIAVTSLRALRWLAVEPPVQVEVRARMAAPRGDVERVDVEVGQWATATVELAPSFSAAPAADTTPLARERLPRVDASALYRERWMFHGPAYQGIVDIEAFGDDGIRGTIAASSAPGALLDNAGQLLGYWVMEATERDRLAMPCEIERASFFGPEPAPRERVSCTVRVRRLAEQDVVADMELSHVGGVWARIEGWKDRRFETNDRTFSLMRFPESTRIADVRQGGWVVVREPWQKAASQDYFARRYLSSEERRQLETVAPRARRGWLLGRIAVKDAVRAWSWERGHGPIFPVEVATWHDASGRPMVRAPWTPDLRVSVAHKDGIAVATCAEGADVGIDVEAIEPRPDGFEQAAFTAAERALLDRLAAAGHDRTEQVARMWAAKEAVGKARGTGLAHDPKSIEITEATGSTMLAGGVRVDLARDGAFVIAWCRACP